MAKDIRNLKKLVESYYEDMPTGEYELCQRCFGGGCEECEQGLKDITGQHKIPDMSSLIDKDITEAAGTSTIHVPRDEWPTMIILKRKLAAGGVPNAELINSHYGEHYIGIRVPSDSLQAAKDVVLYWRDDEQEQDSWGRRSAYSNSEYANGDSLPLTKYSVMDSKMAEGYSSPPPFGDMIKAGFPDVAPGDRIRTRKGDHTGIITKIRVHPEKGTEEVFFEDDTGKKFKTPLSNVLKVSSVGEALDPLEYPEDEEEEKTYMFKDGDKVRLTRDYSDGSGEVFWVSQCDPDRKRCWIGDKQGFGWYVSFGQIEPVKRKKNSFGLREAFGAPMEMEYDGFGYYYDIEEEEDNRKIWHYAVLPGGKEETLDLSPYSRMDQETFKAFVDYYKQNQRFPTRADIGSIGPLYREDVLKLVPENTLGDDMKEAAGDSLDKALARMRTPKYLEKRAIDQLKSLPQPITVNGGGYAYSANIKKDPYTWTASDGSPIKIKKLADIGAYFERYVQEEWDDFLDDVQDVDDLVRMGYIRSGAGGAYRDQADFEYKQMIGDAVGTEPPHTIVWSMGHNYKEVMRNAVKELGLQIDSQGYEGGSTLWSIVFYNDKKLTPDQWDDLLRDKVGEQLGMGSSYPNWMEVEAADDMFESTEKRETTMNENDEISRMLRLAGMNVKPEVYEMKDENQEGDQSPLSDVTDFVADVRGEKAKDPEKFVNVDGDKSVLSEKDVEEGWDPFQDELDAEEAGDDDWYDFDDQSQEDFPGRSSRFANPGSALYAANARNPRIHACPTCGGENRLTQRDLDAGYQCDRCADAAEFGLDVYREGIDEASDTGEKWDADFFARAVAKVNPNLDVNNDADSSAFRQAIMSKLKELGFTPKQIRYYMGYDEDFVQDIINAYCYNQKAGLEEAEVEEDYLEPPHQPDPHTNEEDDWYDPEDARRHVARMGAHPEFTGRHKLKPHDPVRDQEQEDEWILNKNAEEEQMAAMDDWDVFNKKGVEEAGLNNGYGEHHVVDGEDFFPSGATSNVARKVGPSGARHGNNPMSQKMANESAKIYEQYKRDFQDFKKK